MAIINNKIINIKIKNNLIHNNIITIKNKINNSSNNHNKMINKSKINQKMKTSSKKEIQFIYLILQNTIILQIIFLNFIKNLDQQKTFIVI